jgi:hypothetical protein
MTTRLGVILPDLPDMGVWRVETHSYYSASEIAAAVDMLKGQLGQSAMVPVRLRIEPRTRVAGGKTKQFPVVTLGLRDATAGQVMAGQIPTQEIAAPAGQAQAVAAGEAPAAIAAPARDWLAEVRAAGSLDDLRALYAEAREAGAPDGLAAAMKERATELDAENHAAAPASAPAADPGAYIDGLGMQCVAAAPDGWSTTDLMEAFAARHDVSADDASAEQMAGFLAALQTGAIAKARAEEPAVDPSKIPF